MESVLNINWAPCIQDALRGNDDAVRYIYRNTSELIGKEMQKLSIPEEQMQSIRFKTYTLFFRNLQKIVNSPSRVPFMLRQYCIRCCINYMENNSELNGKTDFLTSLNEKTVDPERDIQTFTKMVFSSVTAGERAALMMWQSGASLNEAAEILAMDTAATKRVVDTGLEKVSKNVETMKKAGVTMVGESAAAAVAWIVSAVNHATAVPIMAAETEEFIATVIHGQQAAGVIQGTAAKAVANTTADTAGNAATNAAGNAAGKTAAQTAAVKTAVKAGTQAAAKKGFAAFIATTAGKVTAVGAAAVIAAGTTAGVMVVNSKSAEPVAVVSEAEEQNEVEKTDESIVSSVSEEVTEASEPTETPTPEQAADTVDYSWAVNPTIEADDMFLIRESGSYRQGALYYNTAIPYQNDYTVIKRGNALDLIDMDGNLLTDMNIDTIRMYAYYEMSFAEPVDMSDSMEVPYWATTDENALKEVTALFFDPESKEYSWPEHGDAGNTEFYYAVGGELCCSVDTSYNGYSPELIGVQEADHIMDSATEWTTFYGDLSGKYALYADGEQVSDFEYDAVGGYMNGSEDTLIAVSKDGKWGYADKSGNIVIPIEYDASWGYCLNDGLSSTGNEKDTVDGTDTAFSDVFREVCYAPSEGYINLYKDGEWSLVDTEGNTAIEAGEFEEILPVYNSKCWVKKDGKWGVIQLEADEKADETAAEEASMVDWRGLYADFLNNGGYSNEFSIAPLFTILDIDQDSVPELLLMPYGDHAGYVAVYTVYDEQVQYAGQFQSDYSEYSYYQDSKVISGTWIGGGVEMVVYNTLESGQLTQTAVSLGQFDTSAEGYVYQYSVGASVVTEDGYNEYVNNLGEVTASGSYWEAYEINEENISTYILNS